MLYFVRHGETNWNDTANTSMRRLHGKYSEEPLNAAGRKQAFSVAKKLAVATNGKIAAIYANPKKRTLQTAEIIAQSFPGIAIYKSRFLDGFDFGTYNGAHVRDLPSDIMTKYQSFDNMDWKFPGGGESKNDMIKRIDSFFADVPYAPLPIVIVCDGSLISCMMKTCGHMRPSLKILNTELICFERDKNNRMTFKV